MTRPEMKTYLWGLLHNCIAHPLMGAIPCRWTFAFHDWSSRCWLAEETDNAE